ncbi:MAG: metallophosphoesterase [Actinobacteria bacterium]|nr:metallophosphoesterase [Actinomycetota bacterium]
MHRPFTTAGLVKAAAGLAIAALAAATQAQSSAPVVLTFSTVGDSRQDPVTFDKASVGNSLTPQDAMWLQNTKAIARILRTIQAQKSTMLFFNGDMVHGYGWADIGYTSNLAQTSISSQVLPTTKEAVIGSDLLKFYQQYAFWRGMVAPVMETGTYVFPVPGNHETECKACAKNSDGQRVAKVENEQAWAANMGDLILDTARFTSILGTAPANPAFGPASGSPDGLTTDQSKLGYSFDYKNQHFVVINTDPVGAETSAPAQWLAADLAAARARSGIQKIFVFGHKPAFTYDYLGGINGQHATGAGLDATAATTTKRDAFWAVIEQYNATYFCGHEHIYNISRPQGGAYQVLVGSGGSPFDDSASNNGNTVRPSTDRSYSWATVRVHSDGAVDILGYGFDEHFGATQLYDQVFIAP